ncbi:MAG TPA: response regulator, partial [Pirellulales bacterium]
MRQSLVALLEAIGFAVRAFPGAGSFQQFYRASMPGCLLLDVRMPGTSGLELYEQLLRDGKRLPVIFMTAHADVSMAVSAMKSGAVEFLEKPFERSTLEDRVRRALALDQQWRENEAQYAAAQTRLDC